MPVRVGINGFGRTGRATFRAAHECDAAIEWVGINDVMDIEMLAHLVRHDLAQRVLVPVQQPA